MGTEEDLQARPESGTRAEYGPTVIRLSVGSERKKARKKAVAGLASLLALGGCGAALVLGSGIMNGPRPDSREDEVAAIVEATMRAYENTSPATPTQDSDDGGWAGSSGGAYGFGDENGEWVSLTREEAQLYHIYCVGQEPCSVVPKLGVPASQINPDYVYVNPAYTDAVTRLSTQAMSGEIGESEARRELVGIAGEIGKDSLAWVMRRVPIYNVETGQWQSTDSYLKEAAAESAIDPDSLLAQDPIAVGIDLMFGYSIFETEDTPCSIKNDDYFVCVAEMWGMDRDWFIP